MSHKSSSFSAHFSSRRAAFCDHRHAIEIQLIGTDVATAEDGGWPMSLVRLLGFRTLACGCVIGRYRELATSRELTYVEEKGVHCEMQGHRRNHTVSPERLSSHTPSLTTTSSLATAKAS
jgi:hypothetical protein